MRPDYAFPTIADLRRAARWRIPSYIWGYLDGGAGQEHAIARSAEALDRVVLMPGMLTGTPKPDFSTEILGRTYALPFGIAPVGMSGTIWPRAEMHLARLAAAERIPYCMSTVAAETPEDVGPLAGGMGWFQLYAPNTPEMRQDVLKRARDSGFHTLILTVDVPILSRRPRELRQRLANPMPITPRIVLQSALRPAWALGMVGRPIPRPRLYDKYTDDRISKTTDKHIGMGLRCNPDWAYLDTLRAEWDGPLIVKGVLDARTAGRLIDAGADALWVSNHGGRQFEAAPATIDVLPAIREAVGPDYPLIFDSGVKSGTDILRAIALGADFVMLGRAFHYGLGAAGAAGAAQAVHILREEMRIDMAQLGIDRPVEARGCLPPA